MSILISGMGMPTNGNETIIRIQPDGTVLDQYGHYLAITAILVPPHGRLGDLDELHKEAVRRSEKAGAYDSWYNCTDRVISAFDIENAPTVIQADKPEEE